jgi:hypothetical protein
MLVKAVKRKRSGEVCRMLDGSLRASLKQAYWKYSGQAKVGT